MEERVDCPTFDITCPYCRKDGTCKMRHLEALYNCDDYYSYYGDEEIEIVLAD